LITNVTNSEQLNQLPAELYPGSTIQLGELSIHQVTRYLKNRRVSGIGTFKGRPAFIKIYYSSSNAKKEFLREKSAAELLIEHKISTPNLIANGQENNIFWLVFELIETAISFGDYWQTLSDSNATTKEDSFNKLLSLTLSMYSANLIQADPHLDNFVLGGDLVYVVDAGGVRAENGDKKRLQNLGLLIAQFPQREHQLLLTLTYDKVAQQENMFGAITSDDFKSLFLDQFRQRLKRYGKKVLRNCTQIQVSETQGIRVFCQRRLYSELKDALTPQQLDQKIQHAPLLKDGRTATVAIINIANRGVVVKRYNYLGFWSALRRSLKSSRAKRSWGGGHLLQAIGIETPAPLAIVEQTKWYGVKKAYILNEQVTGETALDYFLKADTPNPQILSHFNDYFSAFFAARISHGDMKATNFLVSENTLNVIDLDSIIFHKDNKSFKKSIKNDFKRLLENWQDRPDIHKAFKEICDRHADT